MKSKSADKIKMPSIDELLGVSHLRGEHHLRPGPGAGRSEERRVGKEC